MFLTCNSRDILSVSTGLIAWGLILFLITLVYMHMGIHEVSLITNTAKTTSKKIHVPSIGMVCFRRFLHKKSIWVCMVFFAAVSVFIVQAEKKSVTQIKAAVYDESGDYEELLAEYNGLVSFTLYDDRDQVMDAVRRGTVECGYVLPRQLAEDIKEWRAGGAVTVYQDEDAVAVPVVNEVLFERIFRRVSLDWYVDYVCRNDAVILSGVSQTKLEEMVRNCFENELISGTTFRFEIERFETDQFDSNGSIETPSGGGDEKQAVYPVYPAVMTAAALCALQGAVQVITDIRSRNFYKRNRVGMSILTIMQPVLIGIICAAAIVIML